MAPFNSTVLAIAVAALVLQYLPCSSAWSLGRVTYYGEQHAGCADRAVPAMQPAAGAFLSLWPSEQQSDQIQQQQFLQHKQLQHVAATVSCRCS